MSFTNTIVFIHVLAAIIWLGGMFFIALVMVLPVLKNFETHQKRIEVLSATARRFRVVSLVAIPILLITGVLNAVNRGVTAEMISNGSLFLSYFGNILTVKVMLVFIVLVLSTIHDFILGPRLIDLQSSSTSNPDSYLGIKKNRTYVSWLARINALMAILVVACAVILS
ncbi:MAG: CopD family protein [Deltaproteobacteria bacterium]|nr:CopD family protein [Deltaproteobacteria bacterium]